MPTELPSLAQASSGSSSMPPAQIGFVEEWLNSTKWGEGIPVFSSIAGIFQAKQAYEFAKRERRKFYTQAARRTMQALFAGYTELSLRGQRELEDAAFQMMEFRDEAVVGAGQLAASSASGNVSGVSVAETLAEFSSIELQKRFVAQRSLEFGKAERDLQAQALRAQALERLIAAAGTPIQRPDYVGMVVNAGVDVTKSLFGLGVI